MDEALVEAVARAMWECENAQWEYLAGAPRTWDESSEMTKSNWASIARAALAVAVPVIEARERENQTISTKEIVALYKEMTRPENADKYFGKNPQRVTRQGPSEGEK